MLRAIHEFESLKGINWRVNVWDTEFTGDAITFKTDGNAGFRLSYDSEVDYYNNPIIPSRLEFDMMVEASYHEDLAIDMATGDEYRFPVYVTWGTGSEYTTNLYWCGYLFGEAVAFEDSAYPYAVRFGATDFGGLGDVPFASGTGADTPITGEKTFIEAVGDLFLELAKLNSDFDTVLSGTGLTSFFATNFNWREFDMETTSDPLASTGFRANSLFRKIRDGYEFRSLFDAIKAMASVTGCRFFQSGGNFWMQQVDAVAETSGNVYYRNRALALTTVNGDYETIELNGAGEENMVLRGGRWMYLPGLKSVTCEWDFRRNFLEGYYTNNDVTLSTGDLMDIMPFGGLYQQIFTVKYRINYKIHTWPVGGIAPGFESLFIKKKGHDAIHIVPAWQSYLAYTGGDDGRDYYCQWAWLSRVEEQGVDEYREYLGGREWWPKLARYGWAVDLPPNDINDLSDDIIPSEDTPIDEDEYNAGDFEPIDESLTVEFNSKGYAKSFPGDAIQTAEGLLFAFTPHRLYNRWIPQWTIANSPNDYMDWEVPEFELYVHLHGKVEEKLLTGYRYKSTLASSSSKLNEFIEGVIFNDMSDETWHRIRTLDNGTGLWKNPDSWYRGVFSDPFTDLKGSLASMACYQALALRNGGRKLYVGGTVSGIAGATDTPPMFHHVFVRDSVRHIPVQGTYNARMDEWLNLSLFEVRLDYTGITQSQQEKREGDDSGSAAGGYTGSGGSYGGGGGQPAAPTLPTVEYGTITGNPHVMGLDLSSFEDETDQSIARRFMLFGGATYMTYGTANDFYISNFTGNEITTSDTFDSLAYVALIWDE